MIKVYSMKKCGYCVKLKMLLTKHDIPFYEVDVNLPENKDEFEQIYKVTKCDSLPIITVKKNFLIPGTSFDTIDQAFEIILELLNK